MKQPEQDHNKISKFLSYILHHKPDSIGLQLDSYGWLLIDDIIANSQEDIILSKKTIEETVSCNKKKRFTISDDSKYIRANQGHSIKVNLQLMPIEPPAILYHGTATRFLDAIMKEGLISGQRQHVHLSTDIETAKEVGNRYGKPIILKILAKDMYQQGFYFFLSKNNIWLTKYIHPNFLAQD